MLTPGDVAVLKEGLDGVLDRSAREALDERCIEDALDDGSAQIKCGLNVGPAEAGLQLHRRGVAAEGRLHRVAAAAVEGFTGAERGTQTPAIGREAIGQGGVKIEPLGDTAGGEVGLHALETCCLRVEVPGQAGETKGAIG